MKFENKVVVVTGASSGIGEGVAKMFLEEGAKVVGCGIEPEMKIQDSSAIYVQADLTKFDQAENVIAKAVQTFGKVDKLVCCAGVPLSVLWKPRTAKPLCVSCPSIWAACLTCARLRFRS